jgi:hypothetical protein
VVAPERCGKAKHPTGREEELLQAQVWCGEDDLGSRERKIQREVADKARKSFAMKGYTSQLFVVTSILPCSVCLASFGALLGTLFWARCPAEITILENHACLVCAWCCSRIRFGESRKAVEHPAVLAERDAPDVRIRRPSAMEVVKLMGDGNWSARPVREPIQSDFDSAPTTAFDLLGGVHGGLLPC